MTEPATSVTRPFCAPGPVLSVIVITSYGKGVQGKQVLISGEDCSVQEEYTFGSHATTLLPSVPPADFTFLTIAYNCPLARCTCPLICPNDQLYVTFVTIHRSTPRTWHPCFPDPPQGIAEF